MPSLSAQAIFRNATSSARRFSDLHDTASIGVVFTIKQQQSHTMIQYRRMLAI